MERGNIRPSSLSFNKPSIFYSISKDMINLYSVFYRCDDPVEDDKEKKELGCLTIENGIAPNHGLVFFVCVCCFLICYSECVCVCVYCNKIL